MSLESWYLLLAGEGGGGLPPCEPPLGLWFVVLAVRESADCENTVFKKASVAWDTSSSDFPDAVLLTPIDAMRLLSSDSELLTMALELPPDAPAG